jgi:hypothetical protein
MSLGAERHRGVAAELVEWWEDLAGGIDSRVVLVAVPPGWGRSAVLREFAANVGGDEGPVTLVTEIEGDLPQGRAVQAAALQEALAGFGREPRVIRLLGLDTAAGQLQLGLGLGGLLVSGPAGAAAMLVASLAVTAAGNAWDASPAGEAGRVARIARELARISVAVPVVVVIDDADCLDADLALTLIRGLAGRQDGHVLVVAAAAPDSDLVRVLTGEPGWELIKRVQRAEADPSMGYPARAELAAELLPDLPSAGAERIARRTVTFAEVFAIAHAGRLAELSPDTGAVEAVSVVDAVAEGVLERAKPSPEAVVLAWAGGTLHARQAAAALKVLGAESTEDNPRVIRPGQLVRLTGPTDARMDGQVTALATAQKQELAAAVLGEAARLATDPDAGLVERVVARQAAHHVRGDLADRGELASVQLGLIRGLETLNDPADADEIVTVALAEMDDLPPAAQDVGQRQQLMMAKMRLDQILPGTSGEKDPVVTEAVEFALSGGAAVRAEARVWAAVDLLHQPGRRQTGLSLAHQVTGELERPGIHSELADQWRLLLGFHTGQAGDTALAQRLLATMISTGTTGQRDAAAAVLRAIGGAHADTRLQVILLQDELDRIPASADDDLLRLHHALAANYGTLGDYHQALHHGTQELPLRHHIQGPDHPDTLATRANIAHLTGECGKAPEALRLYQDLLPDQIRVLGPDHPLTLATRANIAGWTGRCGKVAGTLRLYQDLLPDLIRVQGPNHPDTLATRHNIAHLTGESGEAPEALRLYQDLLRDLIRLQGPNHPDTLITRSNIAHWTGKCGDAVGALRLYQDLLPDLIRLQGRGHPVTLATRSNIADLTGECGDAAGALRLYQDLLPDQIRVLGSNHPYTLTTRHNIIYWAGECGDAAGGRPWSTTS